MSVGQVVVVGEMMGWSLVEVEVVVVVGGRGRRAWAVMVLMEGWVRRVVRIWEPWQIGLVSRWTGVGTKVWEGIGLRESLRLVRYSLLRLLKPLFSFVYL